MGGLLLAPNSELGCLFGGQLSPEGAGLLAADVKGLVHLVSKLLAHGGLLVLVDDSQNACDRLAHNLDFRKLGRGTTGNLGNAELLKFCLQLIKLAQELIPVLLTELVGLDLDCSHTNNMVRLSAIPFHKDKMKRFQK